jgi:hypothetical protein
LRRGAQQHLFSAENHPQRNNNEQKIIRKEIIMICMDFFWATAYMAGIIYPGRWDRGGHLYIRLPVNLGGVRRLINYEGKNT